MKKFIKEWELTIWIVILGVGTIILCNSKNIVEMIKNW